MQKFVGRREEIAAMHKLLTSEKSEFLVIYGRRRVGKTFLIREAYKQKFTFQITGLANATLNQQLINFHVALQNADPTINYQPTTNWLSAFQQLISYLEKSKDKKKVVFIDELPWFDTRKSQFIQALEHFWNSWAATRDDIILVACGSATSWIINKLINNKGGLHNRITKKIKLNPFTLGECETFLKSQKIKLDRYQITQLYMALGGIPFYWDEVEQGLSAMQNIEKICFNQNGLLRTEFSNLFRSLFNNYDKHLKIVFALAKKSMGLTRDEIVRFSGLPNGGSTTRLLDELEASGFIRKYIPFGKKQRNSLYQLVDFYTHFYLKFIKDTQPMNTNNWINRIDTPKYRAWSGYAFEQVCMYHLPQIKQSLGISGVLTSISAWRSTSSKWGAQIDLIIDRRDQVINLCEIKYSIHPFAITKKYAEELRHKIGTFKMETKTRKSVFLTLITTFGIQENSYSGGLVQNEIKMEELFK